MANEGPKGDLYIRTIAMPADLNGQGDVFGGWLVSQMDLAGGAASRHRAKGRTVTVAIDAMTFHKAMHLGDQLSCYVVLTKVGRTSMTVRIEAWVRRGRGGDPIPVTEGVFTYVAVDNDRQPRLVPPEP